jgi:DNA-binding transcriptional regulator YhcF (GntR family)
VRTVAGRLGHAHGGRSTLLYYAAWIQEADQRASRVLMDRLPFPTPPSVTVMPTRPAQPLSPYRAIAAELRTAILDGTLPAGATLPTVKQLAARHQVAASTIHRATALLAAEHLIDVSRGRRAISTPPPTPVNDPDQQPDADRRDHNRQPAPQPPRVGGEWLRPVWLGSRVVEPPIRTNGWRDRVHIEGGWAAVRGMVRGMKPRQIRLLSVMCGCGRAGVGGVRRGRVGLVRSVRGGGGTRRRGELAPVARTPRRCAWDEFVPFLDYDVEIRTMICSTNAIESQNARYRRAVRARGHFQLSRPP